MLYGVQYRDMHSAIHHVTIFAKWQPANALLKYIGENEHFPEVGLSDMVDDIEINFRNVPSVYKDEKLTIINADKTTPDCYGTP